MTDKAPFHLLFFGILHKGGTTLWSSEHCYAYSFMELHSTSTVHAACMCRFFKTLPWMNDATRECTQASRDLISLEDAEWRMQEVKHISFDQIKVKVLFLTHRVLTH